MRRQRPERVRRDVELWDVFGYRPELWGRRRRQHLRVYQQRGCVQRQGMRNRYQQLWTGDHLPTQQLHRGDRCSGSPVLWWGMRRMPRQSRLPKQQTELRCQPLVRLPSVIGG